VSLRVLGLWHKYKKKKKKYGDYKNKKEGEEGGGGGGGGVMVRIMPSDVICAIIIQVVGTQLFYASELDPLSSV